MIKQIERAYKIHMENPDKLNYMGSKLKEIVMTQNSSEVIQNKYLKLYSELISQKK